MNSIQLVLEVTGVRYKVNRANIFQKINEHSRMEIKLSLKGKHEIKEAFECFTPVQLIMISESKREKVLFSGIIVKAARYCEEGEFYIDMTASSYSLLYDLERKRRSFQKESRTYGELFQMITEVYPSGTYIWNGDEKCAPVNQFLLQYQESDWEFMKRLASIHHKGLIPEIIVPGPKLYIGSLKRGEKDLSGSLVRQGINFHNLSKLDKDMGYMPIQSGKVYNIFRTSAEIELGSPAKCMGNPMIVVEAEAYLIDGDWQYDYVLKSKGECEIETLKNENLRGTSIKGTVINSRLGQVQLKLESDSEGETVESWHIQPAYYAGTGRGYGGRPEMGDTLQLYFASDTESERYIISSTGASPGKVSQRVNPSTGKSDSLPDTKCLVTAAGLGAVLDGSGIWIHSKGQGTKIVVAKEAITINSKGDIELYAESIKGKANEISLMAKDYIWMHNGEKGVLLTDSQVQMKSSEINIFSPMNEVCEIPEQDAVNAILKAFEEKRKAGMEFFEADGSLRRFGGTEADKNSQMVLDYIQGLDSKGTLKVDDYHIYSLEEIREIRRNENLLFLIVGKIPIIGKGFNKISEWVQKSTYGPSAGWLERPISEGIPKDIISDELKDQAEDAVKSYISREAKNHGIDGMDKAFDLNDDLEDIDEALNAELPGGDVLVVEYTPFNGNGINYTGNERYYLKPNDVKLSILEEGHNGYTGQYTVLLSKDLQGDPMEIKVLWYYKQ